MVYNVIEFDILGYPLIWQRYEKSVGEPNNSLFSVYYSM